MMPFLGEAAALGAALSWAIASLFLTRAGQGLGAQVLNGARLPLAASVLLLAHWAVTGAPWPVGLTGEQAGWLLVSGMAAHAVGDGVLYTAYVLVGPRLSLLMGTLCPVAAMLLAWLVLGETMQWGALAGAAVTLGGVVWVVLERPNGVFAVGGRDRRLGLALAGTSAVLQAVGLVTARHVLLGGLPPFSAVTVRMLLAAVAAVGWLALRGQVGPGLRALARDRQSSAAMVGGAITGPIIGASLSMLAMQLVQVGVASTLLAMPPVFLLPLSAAAYRERITWRALLGTALAVAGVAMLVFR